MNCIVCGNPIKQNFNYDKNFPVYRGRPKDYCSSNCRDYNKYLNAFQRCLDIMNPTLEAKRLLKGQLFCIANTIKLSSSGNNGTKTT